MKGLFRRKDGRSKNYHYSFKHNGIHYQGTTGTANKRRAEMILADIFSRVEDGTWDMPAETTNGPRTYLFEDLEERYMTVHSIPTKARTSVDRDRYAFKRLGKFFMGMAPPQARLPSTRP